MTPKQVVVNVFDLGYLGVKIDFPEQMSSLPYKKKRNQDELSEEEKEEEKEYNKLHSKKRIVIEHTIICRLKKYRIMSDIFRNRLIKYDKVSDMVSGLVNYRIINQSG
ncbi:MAG: transposase family protein [Candidatus Nitrosocosmicus sp.]